MMNQKELAKTLGVTDRTLRNWKREGCPVERGVLAIMKWREDQKAAAETKQGAESERGGLAKAQADHYEVKTRLAEIELRKKMGELVPLEEVENLLRRWFGPVSDYLKTQPDRLAARVNPADPEHARQILMEERAAVFKLAKELIHADA